MPRHLECGPSILCVRQIGGLYGATGKTKDGKKDSDRWSKNSKPFGKMRIPSTNASTSMAEKGKQPDKGKVSSCFSYGGPHMMRDYPRKERLNAITAEDDDAPRVNPLRSKREIAHLELKLRDCARQDK